MLRAPRGLRLVLTALSPTSPRHVVRNAGWTVLNLAPFPNAGDTNVRRISAAPFGSAACAHISPRGPDMQAKQAQRVVAMGVFVIEYEGACRTAPLPIR